MSAVHLNLLHHEEHLSYYPEATKKIVVFDKYQPKDPERVWQASELCNYFRFYLLLSPYLCFISFLYLDLHVLGDDALIS